MLHGSIPVKNERGCSEIGTGQESSAGSWVAELENRILALV